MQELTDASNVLVLGSTDPVAVDETTARVGATFGADGYHLLGMAFTRSPEQWLDGVREAGDGLPPRVGLVAVGDRSQAAGVADAHGDGGSEVDVEMIPDAADLPRLGITLSEFFTRWGDERPIVLAFDSITAFLQYAEVQRVYRFLHTLKGRLESSEGVGLYFLDPTALDDQTVATIRPLFDTVAEIDRETGELERVD